MTESEKQRKKEQLIREIVSEVKQLEKDEKGVITYEPRQST